MFFFVLDWLMSFIIGDDNIVIEVVFNGWIVGMVLNYDLFDCFCFVKVDFLLRIVFFCCV